MKSHSTRTAGPPSSLEDSNASACALTVADIRQWRQQIETFFSDEWQTLRSMIHRLEDDMWSHGEVPETETVEPEWDSLSSEPAVFSAEPASQFENVEAGTFDQEDTLLKDLSEKLQRKMQSVPSPKHSVGSN